MKILIFLAFLLIAACASNNNSPENSTQTVNSYSIESVTEVSKKPSQFSVTFLVKGILPSPAYSVDKIEIVHNDSDIILKPVIVHDPNKIVIQMAVPFEEKVKVKNIKKSCKIIINGKTYIESFTFKE